MKRWIIFLIATALFYGVSLRYGFSQDDFYFLLISRAHSALDVLKFFSPWHQQGFPFFRPLGTQLFYFLSVGIAGFARAPYLMHAVMLLIQATNGYLVYRLCKTITKNESTAVWVGVLYATSAVHFLSLFYIAATQELLAAIFGLLSLNAFLSRKPRGTAGWFALALLSKENAIIIPVIAALLYQLSGVFPPFDIRHVKKNLMAALPYIIVAGLYLGIRLLAGINVQAEYQPVIGFSLVSTLRWYFYFAYGAPEVLLQYGLPGMFVNFWRYAHDFGTWGIISAVIVVILPVYALIRSSILVLKDKPMPRMTVVLYILWWLAGIALVVSFPDHRYPHYLDLGLIPLLLLVIDKQGKVMKSLIGSVLLISSVAAIVISIRSHWTVARAEIAVKAVDRIEESGACTHSAVDFQGPGNEPQELSYVLSLANGPRYICNNPGLGVYYTDMGANPGTDAAIIKTEGLLR